MKTDNAPTPLPCDPDPYYADALREFGVHLARVRKARRWSQERLALESGMARSYLSGIERGQRNVSFKNLVKLAQTLDVPLALLVNFKFDGLQTIGAGPVAEYQANKQRS